MERETMTDQRSESFRSVYTRLVLSSLVMILTGIGLTATAEAATYRVTFDATWSEETHPEGFPGNPHFSALIGGTHNSDVAFWEVGELASLGVKRMAEWGSQTPLDEEVEAAIAAGTAEYVVRGEVNPDSPSTTSFSFEISQDFSLVTLVSMVAPSPDWFVGVSGIDLWEGDAWLEEAVVTLWPHDAGTDSGVNYTSSDQPTVPPEPISLIVDPPLGNGVPLGTFTFTLEGGQTDVPEVAAASLHNAPNPFNPATNIHFSLPRAGHVRLDVFDLAGRRVANLIDGERASGPHSVSFSPDNLGSGVYLYRLQTDRLQLVQKMTLLE